MYIKSRYIYFCFTRLACRIVGYWRKPTFWQTNRQEELSSSTRRAQFVWWIASCELWKWAGFLFLTLALIFLSVHCGKKWKCVPLFPFMFPSHLYDDRYKHDNSGFLNVVSGQIRWTRSDEAYCSWVTHLATKNRIKYSDLGRQCDILIAQQNSLGWCRVFVYEPNSFMHTVDFRIRIG